MGTLVIGMILGKLVDFILTLGSTIFTMLLGAYFIFFGPAQSTPMFACTLLVLIAGVLNSMNQLHSIVGAVEKSWVQDDLDF